MKSSSEKTFEFPRVTLQKKTIFNAIFFEETDVISCFFHNFLNVEFVQIRVLRLSKGLFRETYSIKEFTFELIIKAINLLLSYTRFEIF